MNTTFHPWDTFRWHDDWSEKQWINHIFKQAIRMARRKERNAAADHVRSKLTNYDLALTPKQRSALLEAMN